MIDITVNQDRLMTELFQLGAFLNKPDRSKAIRTFMQALMDEAEFVLREDDVGNIFGRIPSKKPDLPAIAINSLIGLEAIRTLQTAGFMPERPLEFIHFSDPFDNIHLPDVSYYAFLSYVTETGSRLDAEIPIHLLMPITAPAILQIIISGQGGNAGTILPYRQDVLVAASELIVAVEETAKRTGRLDSIATVSKLNIFPGTPNSVPSKVSLEIDIRDSDLATRDWMVTMLEDSAEIITSQRELVLKSCLLNPTPPAPADPTLISALEQAAQQLNYRSKRQTSRAHHDAIFMAQICPTVILAGHHAPTQQQLTQQVEVLALALIKLTERA